MALLRIKRRAQDDPIDVVLLASKKLKTEEKPLSVFRFVATADPQKEDISEHLNHVKKTIPKKKVSFQDRDVSKLDLLKAENKALLKNKRLKVVNSFRAKHNEQEDAEDFTIVDVEHAIHEESKDLSSSTVTSEQYVYDLYYTSTPGDFCDLQLESALSVHEVDEKLLFGDEDGEQEEQANDDEDDSNDEDNWRNDYPDEDEFATDEEKSSIDEDDMRNAVSRMNNLKIGEDYVSDLSSEDDLIYGYEDAYDYYYNCDCDVDSYCYRCTYIHSDSD